MGQFRPINFQVILMNNGQFVSTILVSSIGDFSRIKVGQWIQTETGSRGQYLGQSQANVTVIRWENSKFNKTSAYNNAHLRRFAKGSPTK